MKSRCLPCLVGHEKLVRVYDLERPDAAPQQFAAAPGKVRCLVWTSDDALLLSSDIDGPNITCASARSPLSCSCGVSYQSHVGTQQKCHCRQHSARRSLGICASMSPDDCRLPQLQRQL